MFVLSAAAAALASTHDHCTALAIGCGALSGGRCGAVGSDDAEGEDDFRVIKVPGRTFPPNTVRPVYSSNNDYPRVVDPKRPEYDTPGYPPTHPIGYIPEVNQTYTYFDGAYGLQNEHGVSIGESTCAAKLFTKPIDQGGYALFHIGELSRLALERCKTARCAVKLMGDFAVEYGFYGDSTATGAGEALTVADSTEAWVFHILADDTSKSAVWAAQRVPDGELAVVANYFVIRDVNITDSANFVASPNLHAVAQRLGWWTPGTVFDFTAAYSAGEYSSPFYSARRVWRIFDLIAPELRLHPQAGYYVNRRTYPFSVKPEKPLELEQIFAFYRDHYEGTSYDLTQGLAAGPFGSPVRYDTPPAQGPGGWERAIGLYRTIYVTVGVTSPTEKCVLWFAVGRPDASVFQPVRFDFTLPQSLGTGNNWEIDDESFFWAAHKVANLLDMRFAPVRADLLHVQHEWERKAEIAVRDNANLLDFAASVKMRWDELYRELVVKYQNGYVLNKRDFSVVAPGYPKKWLEEVGYDHFKATKKEEKKQRKVLAKAQAVGGRLVKEQTF